MSSIMMPPDSDNDLQIRRGLAYSAGSCLDEMIDPLGLLMTTR